MDLIYISGNPCNLSKQSGTDRSLFKRLVPTSLKTQNILTVNLFYFENQKKIIGRKRELLTLETVCTGDVGATVCYMVMRFACYCCMEYHQVADGGDDLWVLKVILKVLNKLSRTAAEKGCLFNFGVGWEYDNSYHKNNAASGT